MSDGDRTPGREPRSVAASVVVTGSTSEELLSETGVP